MCIICEYQDLTLYSNEINMQAESLNSFAPIYQLQQRILNATKHTLMIVVNILMLYFVIIDTLMIFMNTLMLSSIYLYKNKHYLNIH